MTQTKIISDEFIIRGVRASYPNIFTGYVDPKEPTKKPKFGLVAIAEDPRILAEAKQAAVRVLVQKGFVDDTGLLTGQGGVPLPGGILEAINAQVIKWPFHKQSVKKKEGYPDGCEFFSANSTMKVGVVDRFKDPTTGKARIVTDPEELYAGRYVNIAVRAAWYETKGKGVCFFLQGVQLAVGPQGQQGDRIDGRSNVEDVFDAEDKPAPGVSTGSPAGTAQSSASFL